jgi:phosphoadenosine phosphosulfate reductase
MKYNPLYDKGFVRVGCIGCPLASNQVHELEMYPKYKQNYINAFQRMVDKRKAMGKKQTSKYGNIWSDGESTYRWWVGDDTIEGQTTIFDFLEESENE